jgi:hypothetical protein
MKHFSRQFGVMTHGRCDSGSWHSNDVRFASKLGGVTGGYSQLLQFGVTISHFSRVMVFARFFTLVFPIF